LKLSKRGEYALRALIGLGMAREAGVPLLQIHEISEKDHIPFKFLEQILMQLKEAGFVGAKRGKYGGYFLNKPMDSISIGQVVRLIDGPLAPISCVSHTAYERCSCPDEEHCALRMLMLDVRNAIANILDRYTLADTVKAAAGKYKGDLLPLPFADLVGRPQKKEVAVVITPRRGRPPKLSIPITPPHDPLAGTVPPVAPPQNTSDEYFI
jgi:Rrf2 family protein